jgi:hypothetical protein
VRSSAIRGFKSEQFEGSGSGRQGVAQPLGFRDSGLERESNNFEGLGGKGYGDDDGEGQSDDQSDGHGDEFPEEVITPVHGIRGGGRRQLRRRGRGGITAAATVAKGNFFNSNEERQLARSVLTISQDPLQGN